MMARCHPLSAISLQGPGKRSLQIWGKTLELFNIGSCHLYVVKQIASCNLMMVLLKVVGQIHQHSLIWGKEQRKKLTTIMKDLRIPRSFGRCKEPVGEGGTVISFLGGSSTAASNGFVVAENMFKKYILM